MFSSLLIQCLILFYRTLSEYNFPQFPETLRYLYKLSVEGPRRSEDSVIVVIFLTEVSFVDCEQLCSHFLFLLKFKSKFQFLIFLPLNVGPYQDLRSWTSLPRLKIMNDIWSWMGRGVGLDLGYGRVVPSAFTSSWFFSVSRGVNFYKH